MGVLCISNLSAQCVQSSGGSSSKWRVMWGLSGKWLDTAYIEILFYHKKYLIILLPYH